MRYDSLYSKDPIQITESFDDIDKMTVKELKSEFEKNLKRIDELKEELEIGKEGCPRFSIKEQIEELEKYNKKILTQIQDLKSYGIDTSAYESVIGDLMASYEKSFQSGAISKEDYEKLKSGLKKREENIEINDKRRAEREALEKKKAQAEYDKKHPIKTFKRKLSEYNKKR